MKEEERKKKPISVLESIGRGILTTGKLLLVGRVGGETIKDGAPYYAR